MAIALPNEIILQIITNLAGDNLDSFRSTKNSIANYATVSRDWQSVVESITFRTVLLRKDRLEDAVRILTPDRQAYIHRIYWTFTVDIYAANGKSALDHVFPPWEQTWNNYLFANDIAHLFNNLLNTWTTPKIREAGLELDIKLLYREKHGSMHLRPSRQRHVAALGGSVEFREYMQRSFIKLLTDLSPIQFISSVTFSGIPPLLNINKETYACLLKALHGVTKVKVTEHKIEKATQEQKERERELYTSILANINPKVTELQLDLRSYDYGCVSRKWYHNKGSPSRVVDDKLSYTLRAASSTLRTLHMNGFIGTGFFWPTSNSIKGDANTPFWPNLRELVVHFLFLPDGTILFRKCLVKGGSNRGQWQSWFENNKEGLDMLHGWVVEAASRMPRLQTLVLRSKLSGGFLHDFRFSVTGRVAKASWSCHPFYRPPNHQEILPDHSVPPRIGTRPEIPCFEARHRRTSQLAGADMSAKQESFMRSLAAATTAIERGWAERHRMRSVVRSMPWSFVLIYAPRDDEELRGWVETVLASAWYIVDGKELLIPL
ncbi:hypothetical protein F5B20DRAFT_596172 [Whalleya microplaca]|nr:hypothetical protein F5B20DRAFT_596172 [Whalleya microplaca]